MTPANAGYGGWWQSTPTGYVRWFAPPPEPIDGFWPVLAVTVAVGFVLIWLVERAWRRRAEGLQSRQ